MIHLVYKYIPLFWGASSSSMSSSLHSDSMHGVTFDHEEEDNLADLSMSQSKPKSSMTYKSPSVVGWGDDDSRLNTGGGLSQVSFELTQYKINELSDKWDKLSSTVDDLRDIIRELKVKESYSEERDRRFSTRIQNDLDSLHTSIDSLRNSDIKHVRDMVFDVMKKQHDSLIHLSPIPHHRSYPRPIASSSVQPPFDDQVASSEQTISAEPRQKENTIQQQTTTAESEMKKEDIDSSMVVHADDDLIEEPIDTSYNFVEQITGTQDESINWDSIIQSHEKNVKDVNDQFSSLQVQVDDEEKDISRDIHPNELDSLHSKNSPIDPPPVISFSSSLNSAVNDRHQDDVFSDTEIISPPLGSSDPVSQQEQVVDEDEDSNKALHDQLKDRSKVPSQLVGFLESVDTSPSVDNLDSSSVPNLDSTPSSDPANLHHLASIAFEKWMLTASESDPDYASALSKFSGDNLIFFQASYFADHHNSSFNVSKYCKSHAKKLKRRSKRSKKPWEKQQN
eukprot:CAMPEP_0117427440 /NCGR_PEP_ID=MMETSP0758-20121206/7287_1 /TAXON_ID=63605 /ORGANISM="Percolomonas cosmopolitus, Strain AE-1 (ATCC 50343)" /LENGTH=507 /DNA_ID=CAMNT_0005213077 /DNA_START=98 /DNA_END=1621 /DNA_ORIENTATION=+